jgi:hypothetical protein
VIGVFLFLVMAQGSAAAAGGGETTLQLTTLQGGDNG